MDVCRLLTSYRSSPEVTAVFSALVNMGDDIKLASVRRAGLEPRREVLANDDELAAALRGLVAEATREREDEPAGLTAIVAHDGKAAYRIAKLLDDEVPVLRIADAARVQRGDRDPVHGEGTRVRPRGHRRCRCADVPDTPLARRRLYTAVSRAMHQVTLLAVGELSPLLAAV